MNPQTIQTDVLVIGGGGAGFRAAIGARAKGVKVTLVSKGPLARCGASPMAGADFTLDGKSMSRIDGLVGDPNDSPEKVFNDIVTQGCYLNNQKLVQQYIERAPTCLRELIDWGVKIKMSDERMVFTSGLHIMDILMKRAQSLGVELMEDVAVLELFRQDGQIAGGVGLNIRNGQVVNFQAKSVVMATGGWHKAFFPNTGMRDLSGEGMAMGLRAGAALGNMEFITFCCNVFYDPPVWQGSLAPYILSILLGGRLTNKNGEEFLKQYDPFMVHTGTFTEWNKSFISHASAKEIRSGRGGEHGGVFFSRGDAAWEDVEAAASVIFPKWRYKAVDLRGWGEKLKKNKPVEVGPAVEYFEGGLLVNEKFETTLPGLFAAGECTLGVFGANRVFAAITEMLVQGADAGAGAADYARNTGLKDLPEDQKQGLFEKIQKPLKNRKGINPAKLRRHIQKTAHKYLGPIRNQAELNELISFLEKIRQEDLPRLSTTTSSLVYNKEWLDALELPNLVQLLETAARSALIRTESRGVHFREDFPLTDNNTWLKESVAQLNGSDLEISHRPLTITSMTPDSGQWSYLDFIKSMMQAHSNTKGKH